MKFKKWVRILLGLIDEDEIRRRHSLDTPSPSEGIYHENDFVSDTQQRLETREHLDKANRTLYRFEMQRSLRTRRY